MGINRHIPFFEQILYRTYVIKMSMRENDGVRFDSLAEVIFRPALDLGGGKIKTAVYERPSPAFADDSEDIYKHNAHSRDSRSDIFQIDNFVLGQLNGIHTGCWTRHCCKINPSEGTSTLSWLGYLIEPLQRRPTRHKRGVPVFGDGVNATR